MQMRSFASALALIGILAGPRAVAAQHEDATHQGTDIVGIAQSTSTFSTLVTALQAAGLVETLKSDGPFTVFAPTDEAFAKLPEGTIEALLADKQKLAAVLTYHVVPGKITSGDVVRMNAATTVQGSTIAIDASDGVHVNNAQVIQADIMASNGVIHVIDTVLIP
jgi:uncharacterized surface protein with fasciclin (FAS1) repeats